MSNRFYALMLVALAAIAMAYVDISQAVRISKLEAELATLRDGVQRWAGADAETDDAQNRFNHRVMEQLEMLRLEVER